MSQDIRTIQFRTNHSTTRQPDPSLRGLIPAFVTSCALAVTTVLILFSTHLVTVSGNLPTVIHEQTKQATPDYQVTRSIVLADQVARDAVKGGTVTDRVAAVWGTHSAWQITVTHLGKATTVWVDRSTLQVLAQSH